MDYPHARADVRRLDTMGTAEVAARLHQHCGPLQTDKQIGWNVEVALVWIPKSN
jgi:hypothetical protein